jgi:purine nucleosidase
MSEAAGRIPILVDCDTGIDDSLALLYAVASPECELVAVTCTGGNVDARQVAENTRAVLEMAGRSDVEVALGRETPLARALVTTPETHGPRGIGYAELPPATMPLSPRFSPDLIVEEARRHPGELILVTLAPLTNVALAVLREPELPQLLRRLVIMGGSYRSPGNTAPTTEWNVSVDPEAARIVFEAFGSGAAGGTAGGRSSADGAAGGQISAAGARSTRPTALGLDVTERAKMLPEHLAALAARAGCAADGSIEGGLGGGPIGTSDDSGGGSGTSGGTSDDSGGGSGGSGGPSVNPIVRYLADALRFYMEFHSRYDGFYGAFIHDPLALAAALDPTLVRTEPLTVDVELGGRLTTGETVADWRRVWGRPPNVDVAVEADTARFMALFIERVGDLASELIRNTP